MPSIQSSPALCPTLSLFPIFLHVLLCTFVSQIVLLFYLIFHQFYQCIAHLRPHLLKSFPVCSHDQIHDRPVERILFMSLVIFQKPADFFFLRHPVSQTPEPSALFFRQPAYHLSPIIFSAFPGREFPYSLRTADSPLYSENIKFRAATKVKSTPY